MQNNVLLSVCSIQRDAGFSYILTVIPGSEYNCIYYLKKHNPSILTISTNYSNPIGSLVDLAQLNSKNVNVEFDSNVIFASFSF